MTDKQKEALAFGSKIRDLVMVYSKAAQMYHDGSLLFPEMKTIRAIMDNALESVRGESETAKRARIAKELKI